MKLCHLGIHRWEEKEQGALLPTIKKCKDCGSTVKDHSLGKVYHIPEGSDSRIIDLDRIMLSLFAAGILAVLFTLIFKGGRE